jgi:hypothetical protein
MAKEIIIFLAGMGLIPSIALFAVTIISIMEEIDIYKRERFSYLRRQKLELERERLLRE